MKKHSENSILEEVRVRLVELAELVSKLDAALENKIDKENT